MVSNMEESLDKRWSIFYDPDEEWVAVHNCPRNRSQAWAYRAPPGFRCPACGEGLEEEVVEKNIARKRRLSEEEVHWPLNYLRYHKARKRKETKPQARPDFREALSRKESQPASTTDGASPQPKPSKRSTKEVNRDPSVTNKKDRAPRKRQTEKNTAKRAVNSTDEETPVNESESAGIERLVSIFNELLRTSVNSRQPQHLSGPASVDPMFQILLKMAAAGISITVTLNVHGMVISGHLTSEREFVRILQQTLLDAIPADSLENRAVRKAISDIAENLATAAEASFEEHVFTATMAARGHSVPLPAPPEYVLLKDATVHMVDGQLQYPFWRCSAHAVEGFALGSVGSDSGPE